MSRTKESKKVLKFESESDSEKEEQVKDDEIEHKTEELEIRRMTLHKQILHRPDTYIGAIARLESSDKIWTMGQEEKFVCRKVVYSEALLRIFMEALSNSIDNIWRSKQFNVPCKTIKININRETGEFSVWNDGKPISLDKFTDEDGTETDQYKPEVIFGELLTSTNYDDNEKRKTSGRNGYGAKTCLKSDTPIRLLNGLVVPIKDINTGDFLIGDDGTKRIVLAKTTGTGTLYEVRQQIGMPYTVNENHILSLNNTTTNETVNIPVKSFLALPQETKNILQGYTSTCVQWPEKEVKLDPYLLGSWLASENKDMTHWETLYAKTATNGSTFEDMLSLYNISSAGEKSIPTDYLINSQTIRIKLLCGLIEFQKKNFIQCSGKKLTDDIELLIQSLGFRSHIIWNKPSTFSMNNNATDDGKKKLPKTITLSSGKVISFPLRTTHTNNSNGQGKSMIHIFGGNTDPVTKEFCSKYKCKNVTRNIVTVKQVTDGDYVGLEVDGNNLFCMRDFTVTHNCNIFALRYNIHLFNPNFGFYKQAWKNNMFDKQSPVITTDRTKYPKGEGKFGFTQVSWVPDYSRFGMTGLDDEFMSIAEKTIYDYAMIARLNQVTVFYNDEEIPISDLKSYSLMYFKDEPEEIIQVSTDSFKVLLAPRADVSAKSKLMHISFINGILTCEGGIHVDGWEEAMFRPIVDKVNGKKEEPKTKKKGKDQSFKINIDHVRQHFTMFVVGEVNNPEFRGQNKTYFSGPKINIEVPKSVISKLCKWSFMDRLQDTVRLSELSKLKDEGKKKRNYVKVEGLDDANNAGDPKLGKECILCLTEGLSAKTYVIAGMKYGLEGKVGRDWIGCYPLKGKILNTRNASNKSILGNKEVVGIIRALGLEYGTDYSTEESRKRLRYGKLYMISDPDFDGAHINSLGYNMLDSLFFSLLENEDFFHILRIPIIKINMKNERMTFLFQNMAEQWIKDNNPGRKQIKYFKGLGTATKKDIQDDFGRYPVSIIRDEKGIELLNQIFHKDESDFRKEWLMNHKPKEQFRNTADYEIEKKDISSYLNDEMIYYSLDSCRRSIPNVIDGLKQSQRKILFAAFKKKLSYKNSPLKTAQFSGFVAETTEYHHGEQILYDTITKMAQRYTGSNNIPIFLNLGQFGSRSENGKDSAAARYTFVKFDYVTEFMFRSEDSFILENIIDEGSVVEPIVYYPIVPFALISGSSGIGTGTSTTIPSYNIFEIIEWIKIWLDNEGKICNKVGNIEFWDTPPLVPFFRGFTGKIEVEGSKIITQGIITQINSNQYRITEIPIGRRSLSINKYKEFLEDLKEAKSIKKINDQSTEDIPNFTITVDEDCMNPNLNNMKLTDTMSTSNMILFDENETLRKFDTVEGMLLYWCPIRFDKYKLRKQGQLKKLKEDLKWVENKIKFIEEINSGNLVIKNKAEDIITEEMINLGFDKKLKKNIKNEEEMQENEEKNIENDITCFDYLLNMKMRSLNNKGKVYCELIAEKNSLLNEISLLESTKEAAIWKAELEELKNAVQKWEIIEKERESDKKEPQSGGKRKK